MGRPAPGSVIRPADRLTCRSGPDGRTAGVRGTPTIYINGRKFNSPSGYNVEAFSAVIDKYILQK